MAKNILSAAVLPFCLLFALSARGQHSAERRLAQALYAPPPEYPYEARRLKISGSGIYVLRVNFETGAVTSVETFRSTGYSMLDNAAVDAFKKWRYRPRTRHIVWMPFAFVLRGSN